MNIASFSECARALADEWDGEAERELERNEPPGKDRGMSAIGARATRKTRV